LYGDPAALEQLAATLRARADEVRDHSSAYLRAGRAAHWVSVAAAEYREQVGRADAEVHRAADALDEAADALLAHARQVRAALAEIARIERAATDWFEGKINEIREDAANAYDAAKRGISIIVHEAPWKDWPIGPLNLPVSGDKGWLDIGHFLRGEGVL
jgi:hypothetical protein